MTLNVLRIIKKGKVIDIPFGESNLISTIGLLVDTVSYGERVMVSIDFDSLKKKKVKP